MSVAAIRHFLDLIDIPPRELSGIIEARRHEEECPAAPQDCSMAARWR